MGLPWMDSAISMWRKAKSLSSANPTQMLSISAFSINSPVPSRHIAFHNPFFARAKPLLFNRHGYLLVINYGDPLFMAVGIS